MWQMLNNLRSSSKSKDFVCHEKHNSFVLDCAQNVANVVQQPSLTSYQTAQVCKQWQANISTEQLTHGGKVL